ncbi:3-oxoacyl-[acyl-carrier-protein] reductase FabG-like [Amphiura filiformis]|uniref:3-oxoacyl-[acyl-carrier-protein] reductase FabG-like n=1 Tax=Amphiura filiformis TaxID=82378 RepID=UPI003B217A57
MAYCRKSSTCYRRSKWHWESYGRNNATETGKVFIVDIDDEAMKQTQNEFEKEFGTGRIHVCKCDVASKDQMEECFKQVIASYGALHIVCNNAGINNEVTWERMLQINVNGVIIGTKLAVQYMEGESCGGGVIINTSSEVDGDSSDFGMTRFIQSQMIPDKLRWTQELAQHFVKLIEEPYHGAAMYAPKEKYEIIPDDTKQFRERTGLEDTYMKLRDAAVEQL